MKITSQFLKNPTLIEIDKSQVTIENIEQRYIDVPHASKKDALAMLLKYYQPKCAIIFCGTKKMADELTDFLKERKISAESIHSDIKQTQRTSTMRDFKAGRTTILIATDIAARGIDVSDVEYVINFDIPPNTEYYIHRIGRTGRAGKDGCSITICSSKREVNEIRQIAIAVKSEIKELPLPTAADIQAKGAEKAGAEIETQIAREASPIVTEMVNSLVQKGHSLQSIAEAAISLRYRDLGKPVQAAVAQFKHEEGELPPIAPRRDTADRKPRQNDGDKKAVRPKPRPTDFDVIVLDIGSSSRVGANHIIGAITDRTGISGREIGKVNIAEDQSLVEIPSDRVEQVLEEMKGCKICGKPTHAFQLASAPRKANRPAGGAGKTQGKDSFRANTRSGATVKNKPPRAK